ncbi:MAG: M14 family metallopeptidase [Rubrivivax sp.]|nr:M14 family metallopeptidase [Rubrivivax sp.]
MDASAFFAPSYAEARSTFLAAAEAARAALHEHRHPLLGRHGEALFMDVAWIGPRDAAAVLLISSGCHGVEGYAGSGIQTALLHDAALLAAAKDAGVALLFVHALNPWGFSWLRRTTQENVDLNRNWLDFHQPLPANPGYAELAHRLLPRQWPPGLRNEAALVWYALRHGQRALQTAISAGQHEFPEGLFHSGTAPTWSQQTLRHVLQDHATRCRHLAWIDLHTGLGPTGHGERILAVAPADAPAAARARAWWGPGLTSVHDGSSTSAPLSGQMAAAAYQECAQAAYTGIALEFGTVPLLAMLNALREDQWFENHPAAPAELREAARQRVWRAFFVDTPRWKLQLVTQGLQVAREALAGLAGSMS